MLKRSEISINRAHNINMSAQWFRNYKMISLLQKIVVMTRNMDTCNHGSLFSRYLSRPYFDKIYLHH